MARHYTEDGVQPVGNTYTPNAYDKEYKLNSSDPDVTQDDIHNHRIVADKLARKLSARQVQMIAIAGTIGTGLFLGTGRSLARGGPASMLICYTLTGMVIFVTMLALGEMAAYMPIAGSFCTYAGRFMDDSVGFALTWSYWFNDAVSVAADLVALQLLLEYWDTALPGYGIALIFWVFLVGANIITVRAYGEVSACHEFLEGLDSDQYFQLEYWLSLLKVATIIVFIFLGIAVNCGANPQKRYIGGEYWRIGDAPFVNGISGFASVFVTASFACKQSRRVYPAILT
jgi:AAT family amino acid transporter